MTQYLKLFKNESEYDDSESKGVVNHLVDDAEIEVIPPTPIDPHEYVDLGLPSGTLWAKMNVGANSETDYGDYYQYGKGANTYQITSGESNYSGVENPLAASADTATQAWGGRWHMPTSAQCQELMDNTTQEWTTINGVNGSKFTAQNGNYLFFPASGRFLKGTLNYLGEYCYYWASSTLDSGTIYTYYMYYFYNDMKGVTTSTLRYYGYSVRPVMG